MKVESHDMLSHVSEGACVCVCVCVQRSVCDDDCHSWASLACTALLQRAHVRLVLDPGRRSDNCHAQQDDDGGLVQRSNTAHHCTYLLCTAVELSCCMSDLLHYIACMYQQVSRIEQTSSPVMGAARHGQGGGHLPHGMRKWVFVTVTNCTLEYLKRQPVHTTKCTILGFMVYILVAPLARCEARLK